MIRSHRLFPILLVLITGLLTVWLDTVSRWEPSKRELDPNKPEVVVDGVVATRYDPKGMLQEKMIASRMWQYPDRTESYFETPDLQSYKNGVLAYHAIGDSGRYNSKTRQALFDKKVTLIQPASATQPETRVVSSNMRIDTVRHIAQAATLTHFYHGKSSGSAVGFIYEQQTGQLQLLSNAKVTYEK
ncbi:LPS export ABC transporter periplasmic protein LptC [Aquitalea palustris]|uniref:LPS export ABC transporter periplasmic protein LptC n=1 Tax=Aquitalea palustris TaxID=2480983 RepID=A0A454JHL4_9NEIS|nr:LPS export ABC transporter periplasmic protein LptC [Aquitalea palustris]RMC96842.1 LPS export ABC transporter periplasmic protein LptC [Aquitalea palustris]